VALFITILHIVLSILLILIILLQPSKGSDVGAAFGGGASSSMFGPRGAASMLSRATTVVAVLFMFTSISLALRSTPDKLSGDLDDQNVLEEIDLGVPEEAPPEEIVPEQIEPTFELESLLEASDLDEVGEEPNPGDAEVPE
jgi:preprotein translocase subunit SecG